MLNRTSESIVTFHHTFSIGTAIFHHPPGSFRVVKEEELVEGLSFAAYHAISLSLEMPAIGAPGTIRQFIAISGQDLDAALDADSQMTSHHAGLTSDHTSMAERARNFSPEPIAEATFSTPSKEAKPQ